jgi:hypothetical protein
MGNRVIRALGKRKEIVEEMESEVREHTGQGHVLQLAMEVERQDG